MPKLKKVPFKQKLWIKFSDALLNFVESIPPVKKGPLHWLQSARFEPRLTTNASPPGLKLDLLCLWICEIIPIEQFEKQIPSMMRLFSDHKSKRFLPPARSPKDMLATLRGFKETVIGSSWHNLYVLDCAAFAEKLDVDYMSLEMEVFSGGHVAVYVRLVPNEKFLRKIDAIIRSEYESYTVLLPPRSFRRIFRGWWGSQTMQGETKKRDDLQTAIVDLKETTRKHLQRYFSGLLFKPGYMLPSIELWAKVEPVVDPVADPNKPPYKTFWESVGFSDRGSETYTDPSGTYSLTLPERDIPDYALKILCDQTKIQQESGFGGSLPDQISHHVNYWVPTLISIWSLRSIYRDLIDEVSADRLKLFTKMTKLSARRTFRWSQKYFASEAKFKRLQKDLPLSDYPSDFGFNVPDFKRTLFKHTSTLSNDLIGNTSYLVKKFADLLTSTQQLLKTTAEAHVVSANHFTQRTNLWVSLVMLLLSIVMAASGVLSITSKPKICEIPKIAPTCRWINEQIAKP